MTATRKEKQESKEVKSPKTVLDIDGNYIENSTVAYDKKGFPIVTDTHGNPIYLKVPVTMFTKNFSGKEANIAKIQFHEFNIAVEKLKIERIKNAPDPEQVKLQKKREKLLKQLEEVDGQLEK